MTRCVVCGALPSEVCNRRTHDAHYRMWVKEASKPDLPMWHGGFRPYDPQAKRIVAAIDRARKAAA